MAEVIEDLSLKDLSKKVGHFWSYSGDTEIPKAFLTAENPNVATNYALTVIGRSVLRGGTLGALGGLAVGAFTGYDISEGIRDGAFLGGLADMASVALRSF
jgi:hypothetical protein